MVRAWAQPYECNRGSNQAAGEHPSRSEPGHSARTEHCSKNRHGALRQENESGLNRGVTLDYLQIQTQRQRGPSVSRPARNTPIAKPPAPTAP